MNKLISAVGLALALTGCAASTIQFAPIEQRSFDKVVRLRLNSSDIRERGASNSAAINLDVFRANVMSTTPIRFVTQRPDAIVDVSFGEQKVEKDLLVFNTHLAVQYSMRVIEPSSGKVIYIVSGRLIGHDEIELGEELKKLFVTSVLPVLNQGAAPVTSAQN